MEIKKIIKEVWGILKNVYFCRNSVNYDYDIRAVEWWIE